MSNRSNLALLDAAAEIYALARFYADEGDDDLLRRVEKRLATFGLTLEDAQRRCEARARALSSEYGGADAGPSAPK